RRGEPVPDRRGQRDRPKHTRTGLGGLRPGSPGPRRPDRSRLPDTVSTVDVEDRTGGLPRWAFLPAALGVLLIGLPALGMRVEVPGSDRRGLLGWEGPWGGWGWSLATWFGALERGVVLECPSPWSWPGPGCRRLGSCASSC